MTRKSTPKTPLCTQCGAEADPPNLTELQAAVRRAAEFLVPYPGTWDGTTAGFDRHYQQKHDHDSGARIGSRVVLSPLLYRLDGLCEECAHRRSKGDPP